jgi:hypothetical protein
VPTILRFRGFNILIFTDDHEPPHVHVLGNGVEFVYNLNCPNGSVTRRAGGFGDPSPNERRALEKFLNDNLETLCAAWEGIDEQR